MKKNGFTLAEVLITLTIIGVIATMTLPALMTNTQEQQAKTGLRKGINTLTEAAQMSQAIDNIDYATVTAQSDYAQGDITVNPSLYALLATRTQVDFSKTKTGNGKLIDSAGNFAVFFRDGSAVMFAPAANNTTGGGKASANAIQEDGLPYGICAVYDTNGVKGPNVLSNCKGDVTLKANGGTDITQEADKTLSDICTTKSRAIKDQFAVRLRAGYAVPNSPAARWAFEN